MNNDLAFMCQKADVAKFEVQSPRLPLEFEKNLGRISGYPSYGQEFKS